MEKRDKFGAWLYMKYLEWQKAQLEVEEESNTNVKNMKRNMSDFCEYVNMSRSAFSEYINHDRKPTKKTVYELSKRYGDEVYTITGIQKPTPNLQAIINKWDTLGVKEQEKIMGIINSKGEK